MGRVDPGVFTGAADERTEGIIAHAAQKLDIRAQPGEVLAHVARHASSGQADVAGIGITQMDGRKGRAVEVCIRSADADDIRLFTHKNASSSLVKLYHSESPSKSQEQKYVRFVNLRGHRKTGRAGMARPET